MRHDTRQGRRRHRGARARIARVVLAAGLAGTGGCGGAAARSSANRAHPRPLWATPDAPFRAHPPPAREPSPFVAPAPETFALANGMRVLLVARPEFPVVALRLVVRTAGEADLRTPAGLADATAEAIRVAVTLPESEGFVRPLDELGAVFGRTTSRDATVFTARAPAASLAPLAALLSEAVIRPAFAPGDVTVATRAQLTQRNDVLGHVGTVAYEFAAALLFGADHPWGRSLTGLSSAIRARTREQLVEYHRARYVPGACALVVVGATTRAAVEAAVVPTFGAWPAGALPAPPPPGVLPPRPDLRVLVLPERRGVDASLVALAWRGPSLESDDGAAVRVLDRLLGGMYSSRLSHALRTEAGYSYSVRSTAEVGRGAGLITAMAPVATDQTAPALARMLAEVARLREQPPDAQELDAARALVRSEVVGGFETAADTAAAYAGLVALGLPLDFYATLLARLDALTPADIQRAARRYLAANDTLVIVTGDTAQVVEPLRRLAIGPVVVYRGGQP